MAAAMSVQECDTAVYTAASEDDAASMSDESLPDLENDTIQSLLHQSPGQSSAATSKEGSATGPFRARRQLRATVDPYHTPKQHGKGARDRAASG